MEPNELATQLREASTKCFGDCGPGPEVMRWAASAAETLDALRGGPRFGNECGCRVCVATRRIDPLLAELAVVLEK